MKRRRRHYANRANVPKGIVQVEPMFEQRIGRPKPVYLPESILRLAHEEYSMYHNQSFERIQERGGFGVMEVITLLADHINRLKENK